VKNINLWIIVDVAGKMRIEGVLFPVPWGCQVFYVSKNVNNTVVHSQFSVYPVYKQTVVPKDQVGNMWPKILELITSGI